MCVWVYMCADNFHLDAQKLPYSYQYLFSLHFIQEICTVVCKYNFQSKICIAVQKVEHNTQSMVDDNTYSV